MTGEMGKPRDGGKSAHETRGVEVLVKKASVDPEFRELLLNVRANAAHEIGLYLDANETAFLNSVPAEQLSILIAQARVEPYQQSAFEGRTAAMMLASLTKGCCRCDHKPAAENTPPCISLDKPNADLREHD